MSGFGCVEVSEGFEDEIFESLSTFVDGFVGVSLPELLDCGDLSFDVGEAPVGSVSLACLSCHDGTQAMDVVINLPGAGGHNPAGQEIDTLGIGVMTGTPVPMLGTDLTDDHPISMTYGGGGPQAGDADGPFPGTLGDPDFNLPIKATVNNNSSPMVR